MIQSGYVSSLSRKRSHCVIRAAGSHGPRPLKSVPPLSIVTPLSNLRLLGMKKSRMQGKSRIQKKSDM